MASKLNPYIGFKGQTRDAMTFYQGVFGGKLTLSTFGESHVPPEQGDPNLIMHAQLVAENGMTLMASDTPAGLEYVVGNHINISLSGTDEAELRGYWDKLSAGAAVTMPLEKAPWGDTFGMLKDKFGIQWMVNIAGQK